ncbi:MAG: phosphatase [Bacillota bacterium]
MKLTVDTHCHTISSGHAYSTIAEITAEARKKGIRMLAMTDHGPSVPGGPNLLHFVNLRVLPEYINGVRVLKGAEVNIIDFEGRLDLPVSVLERLELVIAGLHDVSMSPGTVEENTRAVIRAMGNPLVDIIAHPGNPRFPIDIEKVVQCAADTNTLIEINNTSFTAARKGSYENCKNIALEARRRGIKLCVGSDAHVSFDVGKFDKVLELFQETGIKEEQVLNTQPEKVIMYLQDKGKNIEYDSLIYNKAQQ